MGGYEVCRRIDAGDAFRKLRDDLLTAVNDVHVLANNLYSRGLISREQLEHAQLLALTPSERKVHLFDAIEARLRSKPYDLYTLLDILKSDPLLQIFIEKIRSSYRKVTISVVDNNINFSSLVGDHKLGPFSPFIIISLPNVKYAGNRKLKI